MSSGVYGVGSPASWLMWAKSFQSAGASAFVVGSAALTEHDGLCVTFGPCTSCRVAYCCVALQAPRGSVVRGSRDSEGWLLRSNSVVAPKGMEGRRSA